MTIDAVNSMERANEGEKPLPHGRGSSRRGGGFTFLEMMYGMIMLSLIGMALVSMSMATSQGWKAGGQAVEQASDSRRTLMQLTHMVHGARRVVWLSKEARYTDLLIWADDDHFPGAVNQGELKMLSYDAQEKELVLWMIPFKNAEKADPAINSAIDPLSAGQPSLADAIRSGVRFKPYSIARNVVSFGAALASPLEGEPTYGMVELRMRLMATGERADGSSTPLLISAVGVRAPDRVVNFGNGG